MDELFVRDERIARVFEKIRRKEARAIANPKFAEQVKAIKKLEKEVRALRDRICDSAD